MVSDGEEGVEGSINMTDLAPHVRSAAVRNPRLSVFSVPSMDFSLTAQREVRINPLTTGINPISFQIDQSTDFFNLGDSYFEMELQIKTTAENNIAQATRLFLANNLANTLIKQLMVCMNGTLVNPMTDNYHLTSFIETVLNNDADDAEKLLYPQGWFQGLDIPDDGEAGELSGDAATPTHADYAALNSDRKAMVDFRMDFLGGNRVKLRFTPNLEIFRMGRLLVPVRLNFKLFLNNPNLWTICYHGADVLRLQEEDISMKFVLQQVKVQPSVHLEIEQKRKSGQKATYPTVRTAIRTYSHATDNQHFECDNPFQGKVPNRLVVGLLKQTAFNSAITDNPFGFGKFNLSSIKILLGGEEYPYEILTLLYNAATSDRVGYHRFLRATGCFTRGHGNLLSPKNWGNGKKGNLFVFDTTANSALDSPILNPKLREDLRVVIDFGANPGSNPTVVLYGEFENILEIDGDRGVTYDVYQ